MDTSCCIPFIFFGIYYNVITHSFSLSKLLKYDNYLSRDTIKDLSKICPFYKKWNFCSSPYPVIGDLATVRIKRSRQLYNLQHSHLIFPFLYQSFLIPKETFSSSIGQSPVFNIPSKLNQSLYIVTSEIPANSSSYIFQTDYENNNSEVTARTYSTIPYNITHSLDKLIILPSQYVKDYNTYKEIKQMLFEFPRLRTFSMSLERFENLFYKTTFNKLISISPPNRKENGISFSQTGLFLYLALMAISTEVDSRSKAEIENNLGIKGTAEEKIAILKHITSWLPISKSNVKFRWASRLVLGASLRLNQQFTDGAAKAINLHVDRLNGNETSELLTNSLNSMVALDSGGALRNTFEEDDLSNGVCSVLLTTIYIRAQWRSAPTVLNETKRFYDSDEPKEEHSVRMIRINDIMRYSVLEDWDAEAIEIDYATPGLTLLLLVPRTHSLKNLAAKVASSSRRAILNKMRSMRVAVTLPLYTLRMTLLLPGKLQTMGLSRLVDTKFNGTRCDCLKLSHGVQRLMFWSEAGRNAYKDDGINIFKMLKILKKKQDV